MRQAEIGIIGGTGLEDLLARKGGTQVPLETPYGPTSSVPIVATWNDVNVAFLSRHGPGHTLNPSNVPYRANIWAMKRLGVRSILASGAVGSLREDIEPGHLVLCDQVIDKTFRRESTFFDEGIVTHVEFAEPFCPRLRAVLSRAGKRLSTTVHHAGTYVCMEGPQFSTRAESQMHRQWCGDLIGMTCMPEAKLAREAEICYALIALPTDYDCWRPPDPAREQEELLKEILGNLHRAAESGIQLIGEALTLLAGSAAPCRCQGALRLAFWTNHEHIRPSARYRSALLLEQKGKAAGMAQGDKEETDLR